MATSNHRLEQQRRLRLIREEREMKIRKALVEKAKTLKKKTLSEGIETIGAFDQETESFFDKTELQQWIDDLVDEWGMEPEFGEIWPALQKEEKKFAGFVGEMGLPMLKQHVHDMLLAKKEEAGVETGYEEDPIFEGEEKKDTWEKSKERRVERQKEIQKSVLEEQNDQTATSLAFRALQDAESAKIAIDELVKMVNIQDAVFENLALGLRDPAKLRQLVKFARRDAQGLVASLSQLVKALPSEVIAESSSNKSNLDLILEQCDSSSMEEEEQPIKEEAVEAVEETGSSGASSPRLLADKISALLNGTGQVVNSEDVFSIVRHANPAHIVELKRLLDRAGAVADKVDEVLELIGRAQDRSRYGAPAQDGRRKVYR